MSEDLRMQFPGNPGEFMRIAVNNAAANMYSTAPARYPNRDLCFYFDTGIFLQTDANAIEAQILEQDITSFTVDLPKPIWSRDDYSAQLISLADDHIDKITSGKEINYEGYSPGVSWYLAKEFIKLPGRYSQSLQEATTHELFNLIRQIEATEFRSLYSLLDDVVEFMGNSLQMAGLNRPGLSVSMPVPDASLAEWILNNFDEDGLTDEAESSDMFLEFDEERDQDVFLLGWDNNLNPNLYFPFAAVYVGWSEFSKRMKRVNELRFTFTNKYFAAAVAKVLAVGIPVKI